MSRNISSAGIRDSVTPAVHLKHCQVGRGDVCCSLKTEENPPVRCADLDHMSEGSNSLKEISSALTASNTDGKNKFVL